MRDDAPGDHGAVHARACRPRTARRACEGGREREEPPMTVVGFHASHEQVHPPALLDAVQRAEAAGLHRGDVLRPLLAVERAAGPQRRSPGPGSARRWRRRRLPFGVVNAPGPALPPGDHRPGDRPRSPRCSPAASGWRSAPARRRTSTSPATAGRARSERNARLRECVDVIRALHRGEEVSHDGLVTVDRARIWTLPGRAAAADRRGGVGGDRRLGGRLGRRADHGQPAARRAARACSRRTATPAGAGRRTCRCTCRYAATDEDGARASPTTSGAATSSARRCAGTSSWPSTSTRSSRARAAGGGARRRCWSRADPARHAAWLHELAELGFDGLYLHHVGQEQTEFIDAFGEQRAAAARGRRRR